MRTTASDVTIVKHIGILVLPPGIRSNQYSFRSRGVITFANFVYPLNN